MGNSNHALKMANTDNFPEIISDNRKKTHLLHTTIRGFMLHLHTVYLVVVVTHLVLVAERIGL